MTKILSRIAFVVFVLSTAHSAVAETDHEKGEVTVRVRAIRASEMFPDRQQRKAAGGLEIDPLLEDLQEKLRKLHYRKYVLLDTKEKTILMEQKEIIDLVDGNELTLRPIYIKAIEPGNGHRVGMWIHWTDRAGTEVLDTRMHFSCGENMLTGTEGTGDTGLVLAIRVTPKE